MSAVIELRGVGKRYTKLEEQAMLLRSILPHTRPSKREMWALRDLNLSIAEGEIVGVLGHNGAGKTTLLRLLAGVTSPTQGRVRVVGRIAPLISLGVGFHSEMSGRENVLINAMLLGLSADQIAERFEQIVSFAELEEFIDTPVKFYSSGMFMRLGFAIVVHVDPSILLVDEILAVGDVGFQLKCFERMRAHRDNGAAILMVSHSMHQIRQLCRRAVLIRHGRLEFDGPVEDAIALHEILADSDEGLDERLRSVEIVDVRLGRDANGPKSFAYGDATELHLRLRFHRRVEDPVISFGIRTADGQFGGFNVTRPGQSWRSFEPGEEVSSKISFATGFAGGSYELIVEVRERDAGRVLARHEGPQIEVDGSARVVGVADVAAEFTVDAS